MKLVNKLQIETIPRSAPYRLTAPLSINVYEEAWGFRATAPDLGMWVDGSGETEEDAINDLYDAIMEQRYTVGERSAAECSEYARAIKRTFEERFTEG